LKSALWIRLLFFMSLLGFPSQSVLRFLTIPLVPFHRASSPLSAKDTAASLTRTLDVSKCSAHQASVPHVHSCVRV
jgi:hypothetical protein